eukprot:4714737-Amphidinium_carterae.1
MLCLWPSLYFSFVTHPLVHPHKDRRERSTTTAATTTDNMTPNNKQQTVVVQFWGYGCGRSFQQARPSDITWQSGCAVKSNRKR